MATKTVKRRFKSDMPYKYKTINKIETDLYKAVYIEHELHKIHNELSYHPKIKFGGHTECFTKVIQKEINKFLK